MTISKPSEAVEIICSTSKRRRWTAYEKQQMVQETYKPGITVSYIARQHGIPPSQLFYWRKMMENGALTGIKNEEAVVPQSEVNELKKRIKKLEQILGQKTVENEILREAVNLAREKKLISRQPLPGVEDLE
jgi:transposase